MKAQKMFLVLFLFVGFSSIAQEGFHITSATKQGWAGGQAQSGYGTNYVFDFITTCNSSNLKINKVWIDDRFYSVDYYLSNKQEVVDSFSENDTLSFRVSYRAYWKGYSLDDYDLDYNVADPPIDFNGEALIEYTFLNKNYFYVIKELEELPYLAYP
ncbi:MAG: hypothetical protein JXL97_01655 [Bacteroidales bacterium]|nr:hypothetical protein [Bacteroidales bacterium]